MKEKKQSANWYIAATHYLTAGFAMPFVIGLIVGLPLAFLFKDGNLLILSLLSGVVWIFSVWAGVLYSSKYLNKTYIIKNSAKIIKLATIYFVVIRGIYWFLKVNDIPSLIINWIFVAIGAYVFYSVSKKHVYNTENIAQ
jgi:hypothetical protein